MNYNEWFEKKNVIPFKMSLLHLTHVAINTQEFWFDYGLISNKKLKLIDILQQYGMNEITLFNNKILNLTSQWHSKAFLFKEYLHF